MAVVAGSVGSHPIDWNATTPTFHDSDTIHDAPLLVVSFRYFLFGVKFYTSPLWFSFKANQWIGCGIYYSEAFIVLKDTPLRVGLGGK